MPIGIQKYYPKNNLDFFNELRNRPTLNQNQSQPHTMLSAQDIQKYINAQWHNKPLDTLEVKMPNTTLASITVKQKKMNPLRLAHLN